MTDRFLLDGNGRTQSFNVVDIGTLEDADELSSVGGQTFHVAALSLRVDRVECEGGFPGARNSRDHNKLIAWDVHVDILQVVLAGSPDDDLVVVHHGRSTAQLRT